MIPRLVQILADFLFALSAPEGTRKCSLCNNSISSSDKCRAVFRSLKRAFHKHRIRNKLGLERRKRERRMPFFLDCCTIEKFPSRPYTCAKSAIAIDSMIVTWHYNTRYNTIIQIWMKEEKTEENTKENTKENTEVQKEIIKLLSTRYVLFMYHKIIINIIYLFLISAEKWDKNEAVWSSSWAPSEISSREAKAKEASKILDTSLKRKDQNSDRFDRRCPDRLE